MNNDDKAIDRVLKSLNASLVKEMEEARAQGYEKGAKAMLFEILRDFSNKNWLETEQGKFLREKSKIGD